MSRWLAALAISVAACTFDRAPTNTCHTDADCPSGGCRDGLCISFATPLDEPVDPSDPPDAGEHTDAAGE